MSDFKALLDTMDELTEGLAEPAATRSPMQVAALAEVAPKVPELIAGARARQDAIEAILAELAKVDKDAYFGSTGLIRTDLVRQIIEEHLGE
jgi:hypothetical protein